MNDIQAKAAIEAILFAMGDTVEPERIAKALDLETREVKRLVSEMMDSCESQERGVRILELEGNISVTHANSNGILVRRGGMVIYRSVNGSVLNISLPSENYHDGILVETGGKFIAEGNIVATRGSTI